MSFLQFIFHINHIFIKRDPKYKNKGLFHAKFYGAWHEKIFRFQSRDIWGLGPKN